MSGWYSVRLLFPISKTLTHRILEDLQNTCSSDSCIRKDRHSPSPLYAILLPFFHASQKILPPYPELSPEEQANRMSLNISEKIDPSLMSSFPPFSASHSYALFDTLPNYGRGKELPYSDALRLFLFRPVSSYRHRCIRPRSMSLLSR